MSLPKILDAKESEYGYVHAVSGNLIILLLHCGKITVETILSTEP